MAQGIQRRLAALRSKMAEKKIDYYMIPTSDFHGSESVDDHFKVREYFSNFTGSNGTLVIGAETAGLWTDGRYFIQAEKELAGTGITLFRMFEEGVPDIPEFLQSNMGDGQTLGFDGRVVSTKEGKSLEEKLKDRNIRFAYAEDLADGLWEERPDLPKHEVMVLSEEISGQSMQEKLRAVRAAMKAAGTEYLMLSKLDDLMWLINIRGKDVACNPVALSYGFITLHEFYLFIQQEEVTEEFARYAKDNLIEIRDYEEVTDFLQRYDYKGRVFVDEGNLNYALYKILTQRAECQAGDNPTESLKAVKNQTELSHMEKVYLKDSAAVIKFIYWLKKNVGREEITELSAAEYMDGLRREIDGFLDLSFPTISAYKENAAMMHYDASPESAKKIEALGMLLLDSGGQYMGGTTDVTRTIVLGEIDPEIKKHFTKVAVGMLQLTAAKFLYGCTGRNLDILARQPLWDIGIDYKCGTGHGIGYILNVHEGPQGIRWRYAPGMKDAVLEEGMVISNEPGVYIEGSHGIRTENIIVVRKGEKNTDGQFMYFDTLTFVPIDRDAIDTAYMQPADIERLNRYHEEVYTRTKEYLTEEEKEWLKEVTKPLKI